MSILNVLDTFFFKWVFSCSRTSSNVYEVPSQWKSHSLHWYFIF